MEQNNHPSGGEVASLPARKSWIGSWRAMLIVLAILAVVLVTIVFGLYNYNQNTVSEPNYSTNLPGFIRIGGGEDEGGQATENSPAKPVKITSVTYKITAEPPTALASIVYQDKNDRDVKLIDQKTPWTVTIQDINTDISPSVFVVGTNFSSQLKCEIFLNNSTTPVVSRVSRLLTACAY